MRAQIKEKREVAKGTLLVTFDLLGHEVDFGDGFSSAAIPLLPVASTSPLNSARTHRRS